jgi:endonuclease G
MDDLIARLKAANADLERRDDALREEIREQRESPFAPESALEVPEGLLVEGQPADRRDFVAETIVRRTGRPVLAIVRNAARIVITDPESRVWKDRLQRAAASITKAAQAVGRIEVEGHDLAWLGTGWLVRPDVIVTNRHVASEFGRRNGTNFVFKQGLTGRTMRASVDFLEEIGRPESLSFKLEQILHIEGPDGPDLAFLRVTPAAGQRLSTPIALFAGTASESDLVAVIGYPARDSRIPDQPLMDQIFGNVYDKKRLAPGQLTQADRQTVLHDCSTLGGNSGSVVLSLQSGEAVGLHFAGRFLQANFAVPSLVVAERLDTVTRGARPRSPARPVVDQPESDTSPSPSPPAVTNTSGKMSYVFPIRVTVDVGDAYPAGSNVAARPASALAVSTDGDFVIDTEAVPADYRDRKGYLSNFLGADAQVPLPTVATNASDVLTFTFDGRTERILRYEHFSVLMSKSRKFCRFSAVNIDGKRSKSQSRPGWRTDPRIPSTAQIRDQPYGDAPKFSRGHMTRREDPMWGTTTSVTKGNGDSMHVTNAVPQMQPFNAGIWLDLEDYALQNARQDDQKISVFTGPFLESDDPLMFGVRVPVEFWKIIAFIHDETGELCATGYTMSQQDFLSDNEFVFGKHKTNQTSIASIEQRSGLSFGPLTAVDPFEDLEGVSSELTDLEQIQFVRRGVLRT